MPLFCRPDDFYTKDFNSTEMYVYRTITNNLRVYKNVIDFPDISPTTISNFSKNFFEIISLSRPDVFYEINSVKYSSLGHNGIRFTYTFDYSVDKIREYTRQLLFIIEDFKAKASAYKTTYEKLLFINDFIIKNVVYDATLGTEGGSIVGVLLKHKARCEGIAQTFKILADYLGIYCLIAVGDAYADGAYTPHSWNIVRVDGKYYHIDTTWNITGSTFFRTLPSVVFFMCGSDEIYTDHKPRYVYPECTDNTQTYFARNKLIANTPSDCAKILPISDGKSKLILVKLSWKPPIEEVSKKAAVWLMLPLSKCKAREFSITYMPTKGILLMQP